MSLSGTSSSSASPPCITTVFREHRIVVIALFFFVVFHHNPSFSVLGPTVIAGHETELNQVDVKDFLGRVFLLIPTGTAWTTHKTIPLVCLSHIKKITQAFSELDIASVSVHPCPAHLHYIIKYIKHNHNAKISPGLKLYAHNDTSALDAATPSFPIYA